MNDKRDGDWQLPVLDRMREDFARVVARDAKATSPQPPHRRRGPVLGVAASVVAVLVALAAFIGRGDDQAVAGVHDAPAAARQARSFSFSTKVALRNGQSRQAMVQSGLVDMSRFASRTRLPGTPSRRIDRILIGQELYFRAIGSNRKEGQAWNQLTLGDTHSEKAARLPLAAPMAVRAIESLRDAKGVKVVARDVLIDGLRTTHYRLPISAQDFIFAHGAAARDLRSVPASLRDVRGYLDVWLSIDDLPRRVTGRFTGNGQSFTLASAYTDYGGSEKISAPNDSVAAKQSGALTTQDPLIVKMLVALADE